MLQWNKFLFVGILRRSVDAMPEEGILAADSSGKPRRRGKTTLALVKKAKRGTKRQRATLLMVEDGLMDKSMDRWIHGSMD